VRPHRAPRNVEANERRHEAHDTQEHHPPPRDE
jgi:hypothetical protein